MRWLFPDQEIRIESRCLDCGESILIRMRNEDILEVNPETIVGHINLPFAKSLSGEIPWGKA